MSEPSIAERMRNRESVDVLVDAFLNKSLEEDQQREGYDDEFREQCRKLTSFQYHKSVEHVFEFAGSEIEKMFLNSIILGFLKYDPLGLHIGGPKPDAPDWAKNQAEVFAAVRDMRKQLLEEGLGRTIGQYVDWLESERGMSKEECEHWRMIDIVEPLLGKSFHVVPQAGFPKLKVGKRGIRADALIHVPLRPEVKIVVECDGYEWHSDKDSFTRDRKRDRLLQAEGYEVIRYSGHEIVDNPLVCAADLVLRLVKRREEWEPAA